MSGVGQHESSVSGGQDPQAVRDCTLVHSSTLGRREKRMCWTITAQWLFKASVGSGHTSHIAVPNFKEVGKCYFTLGQKKEA